MAGQWWRMPFFNPSTQQAETVDLGEFKTSLIYKS